MELEEIPYQVNRSIEQFSNMVKASSKEIKKHLTKEWNDEGHENI